MINPEKPASPPGIHTTLVFKASGLLDPGELAVALRMLGVPETLAHPARDLALGAEQGPWLACGLDSDGTLRLWPLAAAPDCRP